MLHHVREIFALAEVNKSISVKIKVCGCRQHRLKKIGQCGRFPVFPIEVVNSCGLGCVGRGKFILL